MVLRDGTYMFRRDAAYYREVESRRKAVQRGRKVAERRLRALLWELGMRCERRSENVARGGDWRAVRKRTPMALLTARRSRWEISYPIPALQL